MRPGKYRDKLKKVKRCIVLLPDITTTFLRGSSTVPSQ
jgi:hypothetical protein